MYGGVSDWVLVRTSTRTRLPFLNGRLPVVQGSCPSFVPYYVEDVGKTAMREYLGRANDAGKTMRRDMARVNNVGKAIKETSKQH